MVKIDSLRALLDDLKQPVLGLDAYGVIYNNYGPFDEIYGVFEYCNQQQIPIVMMTNNATQNRTIIGKKMQGFGLPLSEERIVSSGCGFTEISQLRRMVDGEHVFVYGYDSSVQYVVEAGGVLVDDPMSAEVIVMSASVGSQNHRVYRDVFLALKANPNVPVICVNPDRYVRNHNGFLSVMGFYAEQMQRQLDRSDFIWMGKPYPIFSELVRQRLHVLGFDQHQLVFCDDNPQNVHQMTQDLGV